MGSGGRKQTGLEERRQGGSECCFSPADSPYRYSEKEQRSMLVWCPNTVLSDAIRKRSAKLGRLRRASADRCLFSPQWTSTF